MRIKTTAHRAWVEVTVEEEFPHLEAKFEVSASGLADLESDLVYALEVVRLQREATA